MEANSPAKSYIIDTASGLRLDLDRPRSEDIRIEDMAGGLSRVCRFAAQACEYYAMAQHAMLVRRLVVEAGHPELALAALHHDSHEAYLGNIPEPLKREISKATDAYDRTCDALDLVIVLALSFKRPEQGLSEQLAIKSADDRTLLMEAARLLPDSGEALRRDRGLSVGELRDLAELEQPLVSAERGLS